MNPLTQRFVTINEKEQHTFYNNGSALTPCSQLLQRLYKRHSAIDSLADEGIRFTKCYTPCALCTPARASILSGQYPHNHGALHNSGNMLPFTVDEIGSRLELFPAILKEKGYRLGYQGKWHAGVAETANDTGFEGFGPADYGHYKESPPIYHTLKRIICRL